MSERVCPRARLLTLTCAKSSLSPFPISLRIERHDVAGDFIHGGATQGWEEWGGTNQVPAPATDHGAAHPDRYPLRRAWNPYNDHRRRSDLRRGVFCPWAWNGKYLGDGCGEGNWGRSSAERPEAFQRARGCFGEYEKAGDCQ